VTDGLEDVAFSSADRAADDDRLTGRQEAAGSQVTNLLGRDFGVEAEVELFEGLDLLEVSLSDAQRQATLLAARDLVFEHEFQELEIAQPFLVGLLETELEGIEHATQAQFLECGLQVMHISH
jgi:hypothetical protein